MKLLIPYFLASLGLFQSISAFATNEPIHLGKRASNTTQQVFYGRFISTPTIGNVLIQNGSVLVSSSDGRGTILKSAWNVTSLGDALQQLGVGNSTPVTQAPNNGFFFPGFIDTHIHAPQYPNSGLFAGTLLAWLKAYSFPMEASLGNASSPAYANSTITPDPIKRAKYVYTQVVNRTLSYGTTTASYFATIDVPATNLLANLTYTMGQRAYIGRVCMDNHESTPDYYRDDSAASALNDTLATIKYITALDPTGELVAPIITPRFAAACTPQTLTNLGQLAKNTSLRIQTHLSENVDEVNYVLSQFPNQTTYTGVYDAFGLLTNRTILAHAVHLSDSEMNLIKRRGSGISHCPISNSALGSGFCMVRKLLDHGIPLSLGTDVAGGYSSSILEQVRQAHLVSRAIEFLNDGNQTYDVSYAEGLYMGTMGGAQVVGLAGKLGGFDVGMWFDAQMIILNEVATDGEGDEGVDIFGWETWDERVQKWVWNGNDQNVQKVWVGGRLIHQRS